MKYAGIINEKGEILPPYNEVVVKTDDSTRGPKTLKKRK